MANKKPAAPVDGATEPTLYPVLATLHHDGEEYSPGSTVTLEAEVALPLITLGVIGKAEAT